MNLSELMTAKVRPVYRDVAVTIATALLVAISGVLSVSMAGSMGAEELAQFLLVRRVATWLVTALLLGMGVGVARFVAYAVERPVQRDAYLIAAFACGSILTLSTTLVMDIFQPQASVLAFGSAQQSHLILPLSLLLAAYVIHGIIFAYLRGRLRMTAANILQFLTFAIIPPLSLALYRGTGSIERVISSMGIFTLITNLLPAAFTLFRLPKDAFLAVPTVMGELLTYGAARLPADLCPGAILVLGPWVAAHYLPLSQVGYLLLGTAFLNICGTAANPINIVLLSKVSTMLAQGRDREASECANHLLSLALPFGCFMCLQLLVFIDVLVSGLVGPQFLAAVTVTRILAAAIPFYLIYSSLRSLVDAATSKRPHNAVNSALALAAYGVLLIPVVRYLPTAALNNGIAIALLLSLLLLAALTLNSVRTLYQLVPQWSDLWRSCAGAAMLAGFSFAARFALGPQISFSVMLSIVAMSTGLFVAYLFFIRSPWLLFVFSTLLSSKKANYQTSGTEFKTADAR